MLHSWPTILLRNIQLLLKSLNTPVDLLSQLRQSISLILRLYACSSSTNLIACKCAKTLEDAGQNFNNERITNKKRLWYNFIKT